MIYAQLVHEIAFFMQTITLDRYDLTLLDALQRDGSATHAPARGERQSVPFANQPASTASRRIRHDCRLRGAARS